MPTHGHYFWNLFPALVLGGIGMAMSFIPMTIAGLAGVQGPDAGIASGLINTSRQIGGAVGLAAVSTIAATYTNHYASSHAGVTTSSASESRSASPDSDHSAPTPGPHAWSAVYI